MLGRRLSRVAVVGVLVGSGVTFALSSAPARAGCLGSEPDGVATQSGGWPTPTDSALVRVGPVAIDQQHSFSGVANQYSDRQLLCVSEPGTADVSVGNSGQGCLSTCSAESDVAEITVGSGPTTVVGASSSPCVVTIPTTPYGVQCFDGLVDAPAG